MLDTSNMHLTFSDDFNVNDVGAGKTWAPSFYYAPNGEAGDTSWVPAGDTLNSATNTYDVSNGTLSIQTRPNTTGVGGKPYLGGLVQTHDSFNQQYGVFQVTAKLNGLRGASSGFWLLPENGAWPPEPDVVESIGVKEGQVTLSAHTNDFGFNSTPSGSPFFWVSVPDNTTAFHTYSLDIEPDKSAYYIDGQQKEEFVTPSDWKQPMFMILDSMTGGWAGDPSGGQSGAMVVDSVKVWSRNNADAPSPARVSVAAVLVHNQTTGKDVPDTTSTPYSGSVVGIQTQFLDITTDSLNIMATAPSMFIHTGAGNDAIDVSRANGTNVLDGGTGSNFLTGGTGADTFFIDDRGPTADIWSTVAGFHSGDAVTLWGVAPGIQALAWSDGGGAVGAAGLTLHATAAGRPTASLTLAGYSTADLASGRVTTSFGNVGGSDYLFVRAS